MSDAALRQPADAIRRDLPRIALRLPDCRRHSHVTVALSGFVAVSKRRTASYTKPRVWLPCVTDTKSSSASYGNSKLLCSSNAPGVKCHYEAGAKHGVSENLSYYFLPIFGSGECSSTMTVGSLLSMESFEATSLAIS